jgi:hypothetical protein
MKKLIIAAFAASMLAAPAFANQCPTLIKKIDDAMAAATVDDATKAKIKELRDKAQADHDAGNHAASVAGANEALKLLGM